MAVSATQNYSLGSPLAPIEMCKPHELPIDIICGDCDEFICVKCAKTDHKDHDWKTLTTAAIERRRSLQKFLEKIKEEDLPWIDEKIEKIPQQIIENKELCDSEIKKLQKHFDEIIFQITEIKKYREKTIRDSLAKENDQLNHMKFELDKKKRGIVETLTFMEENNSTMSDYSLIDNHKELRKILSELEVHVTNCEHLVRFIRGEIKDDLLESLFEKTLDLLLSNIGVTQINSFEYGDTEIFSLEAISGEQCYIKVRGSDCIDKVNQQGTKEQTFSIDPNDMCVADTGDVYFTDADNNSIRRLSPSGSVSTVISTDPLVLGGICQSVDGGLLVTLKDYELGLYKLKSHSRRLVRHITVTGDVIHEYEYQEDGQTRLFTWPEKVTQNRNSDICVTNDTALTTSELVIMSSDSGRIKSVYRGQNLKRNFYPIDVACDSLCNILVMDPYNIQIHLLSPGGEFLKFLLTDNDDNFPLKLSLYNTTLWVGYENGLVKVFQYRM